MITTLIPLLNGYSLSTAQGNPAFCSVHLVESDGHCLLFDCGHVGRRRQLLEALAAHGLQPGDICTVVLSHVHWDHVQNVDLFRNARVLLHPDELDNLVSPPAHDLGTPRWTRRLLENLDVRITKEGDQPMSGVEVLELPGHTPGSIGLAVDTGFGTAVLSADAVPTAAVLRAGAASGHPYDRRRANASVERVTKLADVVHPGHDAPFRIGSDGVPEYLEPLVPLGIRGQSPVFSEAVL
ncbi:MBL fold metallo-hydrolase [Kribbella sp. NPDC026611]|uniref:MBL fold metallo-hydrolase n=1 Tax=Kribbella sp. NPDC026611 TaxID=3154911 RepID=UPI0033C8901D